MRWLITRIKNSILHPKEISKYRFDSIGYVILYLILLILISGIAIPIKYSFVNELDENQKVEILRYAVDTQGLDCVMDDAQLSCNLTEPEEFYLNSSYIIIKGQLDVNVLDILSEEQPFAAIVFEENQVSIYSRTNKIGNMLYEDLPSEFHNLDFNNISDITADDFWNPVFTGTSKLISEYKTIFVASISIIIYASNAFVMLFTLILMTLLLKLFSLRIKISFSEAFKIVVYSMTTYSFILALSLALGFTLTPFIEVLIVVIYTNIALSNIPTTIVKGGN